MRPKKVPDQESPSAKVEGHFRRSLGSPIVTSPVVTPRRTEKKRPHTVYVDQNVRESNRWSFVYVFVKGGGITWQSLWKVSGRAGLERMSCQAGEACSSTTTKQLTQKGRAFEWLLRLNIAFRFKWLFCGSEGLPMRVLHLLNLSLLPTKINNFDEFPCTNHFRQDWLLGFPFLYLPWNELNDPQAGLQIINCSFTSCPYFSKSVWKTPYFNKTLSN